MTYERALQDARDLSRKTIMAYIYQLHAGSYYVSASPPGSFGHKAYIGHAEDGELRHVDPPPA